MDIYKKRTKKKEEKLIRNLVWNKRNKQYSMTIPKKKLKNMLKKDKCPKKVKLKLLGFEY